MPKVKTRLGKREKLTIISYKLPKGADLLELEEDFHSNLGSISKKWDGSSVKTKTRQRYHYFYGLTDEEVEKVKDLAGESFPGIVSVRTVYVRKGRKLRKKG